MRPIPNALSGLLSVAVVAALAGPSAAGEVVTSIQVTDLGALPGGTNSTASDINSAGEIVGSSETASGETHAFVLSGGVMTDIGTLPGGDESHANGINDLGQVVGSSNNALDLFHGFEWNAGALRDLGNFPPDDDIGSQSFARAINDAGLVAGSVDLAGVVWDLFGVPNFPPFPPYVRVTDPGSFLPAESHDINQAGQVVGTILATGQGFRWQAGVLETLTGFQPDNEAFGVNDLGQAVGRILRASPVRQHAALWPDPSTVLDLGTLGGTNSVARDINDDGTIVGSSETATGETVAFIYRPDLGMRPLGTLGGDNSEAFGINAAGQIVGESETAGGDVRATLWEVTIATEVAVDIRPGTDRNAVNPRSRGLIPVAILGSASFDVADVDVTTLAFGPAGAAPAHRVGGHLTDVNEDGLGDLLSHYRAAESGIDAGDTEACVSGELLDGTPIRGCDAVQVVGSCGIGFELVFLLPPMLWGCGRRRRRGR